MGRRQRRLDAVAKRQAFIDNPLMIMEEKRRVPNILRSRTVIQKPKRRSAEALLKEAAEAAIAREKDEMKKARDLSPPVRKTRPGNIAYEPESTLEDESRGNEEYDESEMIEPIYVQLETGEEGPSSQNGVFVPTPMDIFNSAINNTLMSLGSGSSPSQERMELTPLQTIQTDGGAVMMMVPQRHGTEMMVQNHFVIEPPPLPVNEAYENLIQEFVYYINT